MSDDHLKNYVLQRADDDDKLSEDARLAVLAALGSAGELAEVLGEQATSQGLIDTLTAPVETAEQPLGAFLSSIAVQGFRGIGPKVTVPLQPGPGLIVIAGRNGSGKSTLAEALEVALTRTNSRWKDKAAVWSQNWRNLHSGEPAQIRIGIAEESPGTSTIGVDWPAGPDVAVTQLKTWVQRAGQKQEDTSVLGWDAALDLHRPLLSYDELSGILEGRPSDFYDQLYKLLGLEQLTEAIARLEAEVRSLKLPESDLKKTRDVLKPVLQEHEDPRAVQAFAAITKRKVDLAAVRPLITEGAASSVPAAWREAERLAAPAADEVAAACDALRSAKARENGEVARSDTLAADRGKLLELSLTFHDQHGEQLCPVCGEGMLNQQWAAAAHDALQRDQQAVQALTSARAELQRARAALVALVRSVPQPPDDDELNTLSGAREAYEQLLKLPADGDLALADHVEQAMPAVAQSYFAARQQADELIQSRKDAWTPVALQLADWLSKAELAATAAPKLAIADGALKWLQANARELRNERIAPLAGHAKDIWATLRQESNVDLGAIRLEGQKTTRRVELRAEVDGVESEAFGVMSQGELQALALAIFIPRAASDESPFRFLVLDDPIQAMDPSKIDGFLQVLTTLAESRQVVVLTHDDRLPAAIRRSRAPARIVELHRGLNSSVSVAESTTPAKRLLDDAFTIGADEAVPDAIKSAAIPVLCREALEQTAWDVYVLKALAKGTPYEELELEWDGAEGTRKRLALALSLNAGDNDAVEKWRGENPARKIAFAVATKGIHAGVDNFKNVVNDARRATRELAQSLS
ncbi:AAA family ATPase [Mycobacterium sp.]|uniref:AAA family ATPase n=1 Tax=Mycobacterium sp. TaxID=1785 RepID=UPI003D125A6F